MNRNKFIRTCVVGLGVGTLVESCASSNYYATHGIVDNHIDINKSEFTFLKDKEERQRPFVLVKNEKLEFPICLYQFEPTEYAALYLQCTHQGCEVNPYHDYLVCPCHGSEYSNRGKVLQPPAENNLKQFDVRSEGETIIIQL